VTAAGRGPLEGLRVVGLTHVAAGPFALSVLGDFGAEVVNVEPLAGDNMRSRDGAFPGSSAYFYGVNRNKRSLACDVRRPEGFEILHRLLAGADVFVHNLSLGAIDRLGLSYEALAPRYPALIYAEISAWGHEGPERDLLGMDILAQARSGIMSITGHAGAGPAKIPVPVSDLAAGILTVCGILLAVLARRRDGLGQKVEASLLQSQIMLMANLIPYFFATGKPAAPLGSAHPQIAPYQAFPAQDGHVVIACLTQAFWLRFVKALNLEHLAADPRFRGTEDRVRNREQLAAAISERTALMTREALVSALRAEGVPAAQVSTIGDLFADVQVLENRMVESLHQEVDDVDVPVVGVPVRLSRTPGALRRGAAALGVDAEEVLSRIGYTAAEIRSLRALGIVGGPGEPRE
jgi:crotonobetainyl-CoA:carnitine CoA-transferase CaiB-like acyl-CoA transferase